MVMVRGDGGPAAALDVYQPPLVLLNPVEPVRAVSPVSSVCYHGQASVPRLPDAADAAVHRSDGVCPVEIAPVSLFVLFKGRLPLF